MTFKTICIFVAQTATKSEVKQHSIRARVDSKTKRRVQREALKRAAGESQIVRVAVVEYLERNGNKLIPK